MTSALQHVRKRLEKELHERVSRADGIDNRLRQPGDADWQEQATQRENDEVLELLDSQTLKEIEQIKLALRRIDEGQYGKCIHCGQAIASERLQALPFTNTCISCA